MDTHNDNSHLKPVTLKWRCQPFDGEGAPSIITEDCLLVVNEEVPFFTTDGDVVDGLGDMLTKMAVENNLVMFEDDEGIFWVPAEDVLEITHK